MGSSAEPRPEIGEVGRRLGGTGRQRGADHQGRGDVLTQTPGRDQPAVGLQAVLTGGGIEEGGDAVREQEGCHVGVRRLSLGIRRSRDLGADEFLRGVLQQAGGIAIAVPDDLTANAEANLGAAMIAPLTIKTVREMVEPEPQPPLVFENELTDLDLAAGPALAETRSLAPVASTDGSGTMENDATERPSVYAIGETVKAMMQSAWLEPLLLVLAGALAFSAAGRVFA